MTIRHRPIPRLGAPTGGHGGSLPLAGSRTAWFNTVERRAADGTAKVISPAGLNGEGRTRLSARRPDLCGLALDRPRVMGILNVTPDSFSDGGDFARTEAAVSRATTMAAEGVDIIDIGGESTRPGADAVTIAEEIARTAPVIRAIRDAGIATPISIDTRKAPVAEAALEAGADIVNDVAAFTYDPELAALCAARDVPVVLMHAKGLPADMQKNPAYGDVVAEVYDHLAERIDYATGQGIARERIITDPGIGFGKTEAHNLALLANLSTFHDLGLPVLLGASRKRFIGAIGHADVAKDRLGGSLAVALHGAAQGVQILRVHDTAETIQALRLFEALNQHLSDG
ncbi:dihydropteroate synthase [Sinisalibacter aestuarii]|uniref:Dihydropteroate synthase n=1 Tax=Sinisalibacter aestuarii TaxID=2949426 RepID=A0ABQ5LS55_9RHOB|nr:dihydropteroate synthase [Sinisalibacter aestuarii]GKY87235.1 dihydropteroate synthase [Sinisalibacter aestuarii]